MDTVEIDFEKARGNFESLCDRVTGNCEVIYVHRDGDGRDVALIAADELRSIIETLYLLRSRKDAEELWSAIDDIKAGRGGNPMTLDELKEVAGL